MRLRLGVLLVPLLVLSATPARADMIALGHGLFQVGDGTIWDSVQNLTWLQDIGYSRTSALADEGGRLSYPDALSWVDQLTFAGYDDWRLPRLFSTSAVDPNNSEIQILLGRLGWAFETSDPDAWAHLGSDGPRAVSFPTPLYGPFEPTESWMIWLDHTAATGPYTPVTCSPSGFGNCVAWSIDTGLDLPIFHNGTAATWAVRDGGPSATRVPEPSTLLLMGLGGLAFSRRARRVRTHLVSTHG